MSPSLFIFVNGILNKPGAHNGWTDRAVSWIHQHTEHQAEKFEYLSGAFTRRFTQKAHAIALQSIINSYRDEETQFFGKAPRARTIHLVGHSNGCDIILRALTPSGGAPMLARIESVHLIAGACEADFEKNGLNDLLMDGRIQRVVIYVGGRDQAMRAARVSQWLVGWLGLGFGTMGLSGPKNVDRILTIDTPIPEEVAVVREPQFGHSTFFDKAHFDTTMRKLTFNPQ